MDRGDKLQGYTKRPSRVGLAACPSDPMGWSHVDLQRDVITGNFDMESQ